MNTINNMQVEQQRSVKEILSSPLIGALLALALSIGLLIPAAPALAAAGDYSRSWYGSSLHVEGGTAYMGPVRWYDGSNVGIEMTASSWANSNFTVRLYRQGVIFHDYVGYASFKTNGFTKATWTNVGSGDYKFYFDNTNCNSAVNSSDVKMYSW